jgi:hypothetical protein
MSRHNYYNAKAATKKAIKEYADAFFNENPHLAPKKPSKSTKTAKTAQIAVNVDKNQVIDNDWRDSWCKRRQTEPKEPTESTADPNIEFRKKRAKKAKEDGLLEVHDDLMDDI